MSGARGGGRPPSPQEIIEAIRGGRGRGGSSRRTSEDVQRMSIGVDTRTNSLVVSAPEALFQEVKQLVEDLDAAAIESTQYSVVTVPLKRTNTDAVQKALSALVGESVSFGGASGARRSSQPDSGPRPPFGGSDMDAMRRRMEFFRTLQGGGGPPGGFFGGRGGGPGSGFRPPGSSGGPSGGPRPSSSGGPRSSRGGSRR